MQKHYYVFGEGSKVNQIICAILINIPLFAYGACVGWMSPMTLLLQSKDSPTTLPLDNTLVSWMAASAYLVCTPFVYIMAYLGDRLGRKITVQFISVTCAALWTIKLCSLEPWAFVLARALLGISMAGCFVTCPVYTKEISEDSIRGVLGTLVILFQTTGNLFVYVIGDVFSYNTILWICLCIPVFHLILFMMMPESPSYLIKHGNESEAKRVIAWLRCRSEEHQVVLQEVDNIRREQKNDEGGSKFVLVSIFKDKILFRAFRIAMVVTLAREVCGAVPVTNFAGDIFKDASQTSKLVLNPNQQAMMLGAVQVAGSVMASSVIEKSGRKPLLIGSSIVSGVCMCLLASWFLARNHEVYAPAWLPVTLLCLCIFCDALGLQPISVVITSEIFSFKYRGTVLATTMGTASISAFMQLLFFKPITSAVGVHVAFYFFSSICIINAVYVLLAIPETKKRSLEAIYEDLETKKEKETNLKRIKDFEQQTYITVL